MDAILSRSANQEEIQKKAETIAIMVERFKRVYFYANGIHLGE